MSEKRTSALADAYFIRNNKAAWTDWKVGKAVREGYQANGWVYRAITIIMQNASQVPFVVMDEENTIQWDHPLTLLLAHPNPHWTRQQLMETLVSWLMLSGNAYLKQVIVANRTVELWPISPDRIAPIPSADSTVFVEGYYTIHDGGREVRDPDFTPENTIHMKLIDPANPYKGISPLGAAARSIDLDNEQQDWNTATMQNRGIPEGVFTFKQALTQPQHQGILDRIKERFSGKANARAPMVIGGDAAYTRLSLSPAEMDYLSSRQFNREEIFSIFGVPTQLSGSMESSTYNNFATAQRILWELTVLPLLDNICDALNHALYEELRGDGRLTIAPDLSGVSALRDGEGEKANVAHTYYKMGVPVSVLNERFELGLGEYPGWDSVKTPSSPSTSPKEDDADESGVRGLLWQPWPLNTAEFRSIQSDVKVRDKLAEGPATDKLYEHLQGTQAAVNAALEAGTDPVQAVKARSKALLAVLTEVYLLAVTAYVKMVTKSGTSADVTPEVRAEYSKVLMKAIINELAAESIILHDRSLIDQTTADKIVTQVAYGLQSQRTIAQIQLAIADTGAFSAERSLRIARTATGTAMSVGQLEAGRTSGATHKTWNTSHHETRDWHTKREGETVPINGKFSAYKGVGPRYPCDPAIDAADRINCRCWLTFAIRSKTPTPKKPATKQPPAPKPKPTAPTKWGDGVTTAAEAEAIGKEMMDDIMTIANATRAADRLKTASYVSELGALEFRQSLEAHLAKEGIITQFSSGRLQVAGGQDLLGRTLANSAIRQGTIPLEKVLPKRLDDLLGTKANPVDVVGSTGRAGYHNQGGLLQPPKISTPADRSTMVHEYFHHVQAVAPAFDDILQQDFKERTLGESSVSLAAYTGNSRFEAWEVTRPDQYPEAYYGKVYGSYIIPGVSGALEVAAMTAEALFGGDPLKFKGLMVKAPELAQTFLGALYHGKLR
jgi:HK97 family phage portal protein